ncbi:MAG: nitroreductase family protein, partial [Desulfarculaceae bacterium]
MDVTEAVFKRRSVRSFDQKPVSEEILAELVDAARVGPSGANRQPLEYVAINETDLCQEILACLKWAAYIAPAGDPKPGYEPTAYLAVLRREEYEVKNITEYDVGAAIQTICLVAMEKGLGSCWLKSINYPKATQLLKLPPELKLDSIVALGYPDEHPKMVDLKPDQTGLDAIRYWRDEKEQHFVPKRALEAILHKQ